jgi:outer membrane protein TolC
MKQRAAELSIDTTSLLFPEISFGYSSNYQDYVWCIGPQVSINLPIFDIGKVQSMKAKAEIAYLWKQFTSEAVTLRSIVRRATDNFYYCHNQALLIEEQILPTVQKVFNETIIQHNDLNLSLFDLLQAKEEVFEKQITLLEKQSQLYRKTLFLQALSRGVVLSENF